MRPLVVNIHRLATEDGPGLRSTVFFKGCPLSCQWCQNPEAIRAEPELAFWEHLCIGCNRCIDVCPEQAIAAEGPTRILRNRCTCCGKCAEVCPTTALRLIGRYYPPAELADLLLRDRDYYQVSGGGVTFSGGEPTRCPDYLHDVLLLLKQEKIHTAVQTCGYFAKTEFAEKLLPLLDLIFFDLKIFDRTRHARFTGKKNDVIIDNFTWLFELAGDRLCPRIPLVPEKTATAENLLAWAHFLAGLGCQQCRLLPYNPGGTQKRQALGQTQTASAASLPPSTERQLREMLSNVLRNTSAANPQISQL